jgi:hypothetical protein
MYEMLTGQLPFVPEPGEAGLTAVLTRLSDPAPPLRLLLPSIEARWNDVVARCLEREVDRRLASADDIVRALADEVSVDASAPAAARAEVLPAAASTAPSGASRRAWRRAGVIAFGLGGLLALVIQHRSGAPPVQNVPPERASSPAAPPARSPGGEAVATPKVATTPVPDRPTTAAAPERPAPTAAPERPTEARPEAAAAADRRPAARRPTMPRSVRRDQTAAAAAPKLGNAAPAAPPAGAADRDPPKPPKPRHRSVDPDDGFIFQ